LEVESGVAVTLTDVPVAKLAEQRVPWLPQFKPAGALVRLPLPVPFRIPVNTNGPVDEPPVKLTVCGLQFLSSAICSDAVLTPEAVGVKVNSTVHAPPFNAPVHVLLEIANSAALAPARATPEKLMTPPLMVTVSGSLVFPTGTAPKLRLWGLRDTSVTQAERFTTCGVKNPPLEKSPVITPFLVPTPEGPNVRSTEHLPPGARLFVQVLVPIANGL